MGDLERKLYKRGKYERRYIMFSSLNLKSFEHKWRPHLKDKEENAQHGIQAVYCISTLYQYQRVPLVFHFVADMFGHTAKFWRDKMFKKKRQLAQRLGVGLQLTGYVQKVNLDHYVKKQMLNMHCIIFEST